jgi:hypothetical protein
MNTQRRLNMTTPLPEALRLADRLDCGEISYSRMCKAAAELRRLHEAHDWQYKMAGDRLRRIEKLEAVNQELLAALVYLTEYAQQHGVMPAALTTARAAIAKAEGETK